MKFLETTFDEYVQSVQNYNIHPKLSKYWNLLPPNDINRLCNLFVHGPNGSGKYSQALFALSRYSPSCLKYEKKMSIMMEKLNIIVKISDIHYEVDMSLLGCNSKPLWHEIYQQIIAVISTKPIKCGVIVCREFHTINAELLDIFFSYMQQHNASTSPISVKWVIISDECSFVPSAILDQVVIISVPQPTKHARQHIGTYSPTTSDDTGNLKSGIMASTTIPNISKTPRPPYHTFICDYIIQLIVSFDTVSKKPFSYNQLRESLYDILIYRLNINDCMQYILTRLICDEWISNDQLHRVYMHIYPFYKLYNNNYRPIYHLERIMLYIVDIIHEFRSNRCTSSGARNTPESNLNTNNDSIETAILQTSAEISPR